MAAIPSDIVTTFLCSISANILPVGSLQLVHTIDSKHPQNCHGPNQTFVQDDYFSNRTLDFMLSHEGLSGA